MEYIQQQWYVVQENFVTEVLDRFQVPFVTTKLTETKQNRFLNKIEDGSFN